VWMWNTDLSGSAAAVCRETGDRLTRTEWTRYVGSLPYRSPCGSS
jgi:hypothetical protein